jgi:hypothetical protein
MTTGYYKTDWREGGSTPGKVTATAGSRIPIFDHIFTTGPSPWTKTVVGTNIVTYQAPGGSQATLEIDDTSVLSNGTSYHIKVRFSVGGGAFQPSATYEANGNFGRMLIPIANSTASTWYQGWYAIRTDRLALIFFGGATSGSAMTFFGVGDLPTYDPADPGLCVLLGYSSNYYSVYPTTQIYSDSIFAQSSGGGLRNAGLATIDKLNTFSPAPAAVQTDFSAYPYASLTSYGGWIPLGFVNILTQTSALAGPTGTGAVLRGWIPFIRTLPCSGTFIPAWSTANTPSGDTFTADGVGFETFSHNVQRFAMMLTDDEDLP